MHLHKHYECITIDEEDLLTIAAEEVVYKLHPVAQTQVRPMIPSFRKHLHPHLGALLQISRGLTLHHLPLHIIIWKPNPAGIRLGGT